MLKTSLEQVQEEYAAAQKELADAQLQLETTVETLTAAQNELVTAQAMMEQMHQETQEKGFSLPLGTWVLEPYAFEVPDYSTMQQDGEGNWHFFFDDAGSVLSCTRKQNETYMDDTQVQQLYADTANRMMQQMMLSPEQAQYSTCLINGKAALMARYTRPEMTMYLLQYCHDGVNTLTATFADMSPERNLADPVMERLMDSVVYLPDEM